MELEAVLDLGFVTFMLPAAGVMDGLGVAAWPGMPDPAR